MNKIIRDIDKDIKRCENLIEEDNYLEIIIGIEELIDKYNSSIVNIKKDDERVWNYSKYDLEKLKTELIVYKNELSENHYKKELNQLIDSAINYIKEYDMINENRRKFLIEKLKELHYISNEVLDKEKFWEALKVYINLASDENMEIGSKVIKIVNYMLDFGKFKNLI